jgi:hypothetical protein
MRLFIVELIESKNDEYTSTIVGVFSDLEVAKAAGRARRVKFRDDVMHIHQSTLDTEQFVGWMGNHPIVFSECFYDCCWDENKSSSDVMTDRTKGD